MKKPKTLFTVIHNHRFGASTYQVLATKIPNSDVRLAKLMGIDYEPDKEEHIEVHATLENIIVLP